MEISFNAYLPTSFYLLEVFSLGAASRLFGLCALAPAALGKIKKEVNYYKRIPIINALRPYIANGIPTLPTPQLIRRRISAVLPNHKLYDLRTTFYTRCDEYGVAAPARDEFVGHFSGVLTNTYRDLSDEYLLKEGAKLNDWK